MERAKCFSFFDRRWLTRIETDFCVTGENESLRCRLAAPQKHPANVFGSRVKKKISISSSAAFSFRSSCQNLRGQNGDQFAELKYTLPLTCRKYYNILQPTCVHIPPLYFLHCCRHTVLYRKSIILTLYCHQNLYLLMYYLSVWIM